MELEEALRQVQSVRHRIVQAKQGQGKYPSKEEIQAAIATLRQGRATAAATSTRKSKAKTEPLSDDDFANLFKIDTTPKQ